MNTRITLICLITLAASLTRSQETVKSVSGRLVSANLFKNGLAVITKEIQLDGPGTYVLDAVPSAVHSTLWLEGPRDLVATSTLREMATPELDLNQMNLQERFGGREVTVHVKGETPQKITGKIPMPALETSKQWNRDYATTRRAYRRNLNSGQPSARSSFLPLQTPDGWVYLETSSIGRIDLKGPEPVAATEKRPTLLLKTREKNPATLRMSYLTKGLSWAPSYRVSLRDDNTLTVEQKAVIKNELEDLKETDLHLISGFPNIPTQNVVTPFSPEQTWDTFFQQLSQEPQRGNHILRQQAFTMNMPQPGNRSIDFERLSEGEGPDLYYQPAGKRSLSEGDSMLLPIASADADYSRIVEWTIPDTRLANGRRVPEHTRSNNSEKYQDSVWDAIQFRNPFDFPMTTAPAVIVSGKKFLGENTSYWTDPGERNTLQITKALSVRTLHTEQEIADSREIIKIAGDDHYRTSVEGKLLMVNRRKKAVNIRIRRRFSGDLEKATGSPETRLLEDGVWTINQRNELTWETTLAAGEEKELTYQYTVLVDR